MEERQENVSNTLFGTKDFDAKERRKIQELLMKKLPKSDLSTRPGGSGSKQLYIKKKGRHFLTNTIFS